MSINQIINDAASDLFKLTAEDNIPTTKWWFDRKFQREREKKHTLAIKADVSITAAICLSHPQDSRRFRKSFIEGFFSSDTEEDQAFITGIEILNF